MRFRSKKLTDSAENQPCVLCGNTGTTVSAHANSVALGKGTGIKAPDYYTAWLCHKCHYDIDDSNKFSRKEKEEMWLRAYVRTVARWFELGIVRVC
jgi:hypothetical protein